MSGNRERNEEILSIIRSFYPGKDTIILHEPVFLGNEKEYLAECIDTSFVSYVGPFVTEFERSICRLTDSPYAVAVVNGTSALMLALTTLGVGWDDEVVTQSLSFVATAASIRHTGARPVFLDVEEETLGMDPDALRAFLERKTDRTNGCVVNRATGRQIKAVVPVHIFGIPGRTAEIRTIADEFGLQVVEDAAEALGTRVGERHVGLDGRAGILSFNGNKIVTTGGGGAILTGDQALASRMKHLSTTAKTPHPWEFAHDAVGFNLRLPNTSAAIGVAQLETFDRIYANKARLARAYRDRMEEIGVPMLASPAGNGVPNNWLNNILFENRAERDGFLETANRRNIHCRPVWNLVHELPPYADCHSEPIPVSKQWSERIVSVPSGYSEEMETERNP